MDYRRLRFRVLLVLLIIWVAGMGYLAAWEADNGPIELGADPEAVPALTDVDAPADQITLTGEPPLIVTRQDPGGAWYLFCIDHCDMLFFWPVADYYRPFNSSAEAINYYNSTIRPAFPQ